MLMIGIYTARPSSGGTLIFDVTPFVESAGISTNVHGDEALNIAVRQNLAQSFKLYSQTAVPYVGVFDGASLVWEGRLEDPALIAGASGSGFRAQAFGYWRALSDTRYTAFWSMTQVSEFRPILATEVAVATPDRYAFDTNNRIYIAPQKNATLGNTGAIKPGLSGYLTPDDGSRGIIGVSFDFVYVAPAANWRFSFQTRDATFTGIANPWLVVSAGAGAVNGSFFATFASAAIVNFFMDFNAADAVYAGETGANYLRITNLRLVSSTTNQINTTLTVNRAAGVNVTATVGSTAGMYVGQRLIINSGGAASESVIVISIGSSTQFNATFVNAYVIGNAVQAHRVLSDEIVRDLVSTVNTLNSAQLSSSTALVSSPGLDLFDEVYEDRPPADIIAYLASRGDSSSRIWEAGVGHGQAVYFRPQRSAARAWYVDVTDLELARTLDRLYNSAYGLYEDASNHTLRTAIASDAASVARYAITRRNPAPASTTSDTLASTQRDAYISNNDDPLPRASVHFDAVFDATGSRWPLYLVHAGDTITVRNVPPSVSSSYDKVRTFRVTHTSYDLLTATLNVEPEVAPPTIASMVAETAISVPQGVTMPSNASAQHPQGPQRAG